MKTIKFMGMLFAAAALSFTATSCDKDEDIDDIIDNIEQGNVKPSAELKKSSNELVLTIKYPSVYTEVTTAKFRNNLCVSYVMKITYASDKLADAAWAEAKEDSAEEMIGSLKRDGKVITWDMSEVMNDLTYDDAVMMLQSRKDAVERANNAAAF